MGPLQRVHHHRHAQRERLLCQRWEHRRRHRLPGFAARGRRAIIRTEISVGQTLHQRHQTILLRPVTKARPLSTQHGQLLAQVAAERGHHQTPQLVLAHIRVPILHKHPPTCHQIRHFLKRDTVKGVRARDCRVHLRQRVGVREDRRLEVALNLVKLAGRQYLNGRKLVVIQDELLLLDRGQILEASAEELTLHRQEPTTLLLRHAVGEADHPMRGIILADGSLFRVGRKVQVDQLENLLLQLVCGGHERRETE
mmetsp:Transcript_3887/g.11146  ORF Transcript_3887/g.11146 Transcript_3887/m.11146 type:complete len:254 (+) Transcript_3887:2-763(+)